MSTYVIDFYDEVETEWVDITDRVPRPEMGFNFDLVSSHVVEYQGLTLKIAPKAGESFNIAEDTYFRFYRDDGATQEYFFTGYAANIKIYTKTGEIELDVVSESEYLKTVSIASSISADTFRERLEEVIPSGYSVVGMDYYADLALDEQPAWSTKVTYPDNTFADLLYDTIMMINALWDHSAQEGFFFFCIIINKEIRFYCNTSTHQIHDYETEEIIEGDNQELITFIHADEVNTNLRGTGSITVPSPVPRAGEFYKSINQITGVQELNIGAMSLLDAVEKGYICSMSENNGKFEYEAQLITYVAP